MRGNINRVVRIPASGILVAGRVARAHAAQTKLHGSGYQDYVQDNGNTRLGAEDKRPWDKNFLSLACDVDFNANSEIRVHWESDNASKSHY